MILSLVLDNLVFDIHRSPKRKTLGIKIDREGQLVVAVPDNCPMDVIVKKIEEKRLWIYTKLAQKDMLFKPPRPKEYVSGETFHFLGRGHRLQLLKVKVNNEKAPPLQLKAGRFLLRADERNRAYTHFVEWYKKEGTPWLQRRIVLWAGRMGVEPPVVEIRELGFRWGSCGRRHTLSFHWRTLLLPPRIIDYIVAHEMIHLWEPHHSSRFWKQMERMMPDFSERKQWLAENGARF